MGNLCHRQCVTCNFDPWTRVCRWKKNVACTKSHKVMHTNCQNKSVQFRYYALYVFSCCNSVFKVFQYPFAFSVASISWMRFLFFPDVHFIFFALNFCCFFPYSFCTQSIWAFLYGVKMIAWILHSPRAQMSIVECQWNKSIIMSNTKASPSR